MTDVELGFRTAINLLTFEIHKLENAASYAVTSMETLTLSEEAMAYRKAIKLLEEQKEQLFTKPTEVNYGC
jgi:hypothetical protein